MSFIEYYNESEMLERYNVGGKVSYIKEFLNNIRIGNMYSIEIGTQILSDQPETMGMRVSVKAPFLYTERSGNAHIYLKIGHDSENTAEKNTDGIVAAGWCSTNTIFLNSKTYADSARGIVSDLRMLLSKSSKVTSKTVVYCGSDSRNVIVLFYKDPVCVLRFSHIDAITSENVIKLFKELDIATDQSKVIANNIVDTLKTKLKLESIVNSTQSDTTFYHEIAHMYDNSEDIQKYYNWSKKWESRDHEIDSDMYALLFSLINELETDPLDMVWHNSDSGFKIIIERFSGLISKHRKLDDKKQLYKKLVRLRKFLEILEKEKVASGEWNRDKHIDGADMVDGLYIKTGGAFYGMNEIGGYEVFLNDYGDGNVVASEYYGETKPFLPVRVNMSNISLAASDSRLSDNDEIFSNIKNNCEFYKKVDIHIREAIEKWYKSNTGHYDPGEKENYYKQMIEDPGAWEDSWSGYGISPFLKDMTHRVMVETYIKYIHSLYKTKSDAVRHLINVGIEGLTSSEGSNIILLFNKKRITVK